MGKGSKPKGKGVFQNHRSRNEGISDPYTPRKGLKEPAICPSCHAIYHKKRWVLDEGLFLEMKKLKGVNWQKCPADRKIEDGYPMGIVNLHGSFVLDHSDEIVSLLRSEERHALEKNPMERLMKIEKKGNGLYIETTTDRLALRIGRILSRTYKGDHKFNWKYGDKHLLVDWVREA
jgi:hypothetical protein